MEEKATLVELKVYKDDLQRWYWGATVDLGIVNEEQQPAGPYASFEVAVAAAVKWVNEELA